MALHDPRDCSNIRRMNPDWASLPHSQQAQAPNERTRKEHVLPFAVVRQSGDHADISHDALPRFDKTRGLVYNSLNILVFWGNIEERGMKEASKLTARQRAFLDKLLELYREHRGPVHYSDVAERLGVNRFSAYDMLKVLEEKGFASSSYTLRSTTMAAAGGHPGPGRSIVVFAPTSDAATTLGSRPEEIGLGEDWQRARELVLSKLAQAREASPRAALSELLARLPETQAPLNYCAEMIGALLLNMQRARARAGGLNPFRVLDRLRTDDSTGLETLAGLSMGVSLSYGDETNRTLTRRLLDHVHRYQVNLSRLSEEGREALVRFLEEALEALD